jgi:Protein of unknown function (DUF3365)
MTGKDYTGKPFSATVQDKGRSAFRMMVAAYYSQSCPSCHGETKGQLDITGHPKEGAKLDQLGAVIIIQQALPPIYQALSLKR